MPAKSELVQARALLIVLTTVWGSTFVVIQTGLEFISPFLLISLRFVLAALALAVFRPAIVQPGLRRIGAALPLSLSLLTGFCLQTTGLSAPTLGDEATTPARSAFLTALSVIIVPVFNYMDTKRSPGRRLLASALLAAAGVYLLFQPLDLEWRRGDTLTLIGAFVFAFYIVDLSKRARRFEATELVLAQLITMAIISAGAAGFIESPRFLISGAAVWVLAYLGLVCTALTFVLMTWAQARVSPVEAAIIFTLEPVIAAALSIALGREMFSTKFLFGGALVVAAMILASADPHDAHPVAPPEGID